MNISQKVCFYCIKLGHIKRNCYVLKILNNQKELEPSKSFLLECYVSILSFFVGGLILVLLFMCLWTFRDLGKSRKLKMGQILFSWEMWKNFDKRSWYLCIEVII